MKLPESFGNVVGELPVGGRLPDGQEFPSGTLRPVRDGFVQRNDVKSSDGGDFSARLRRAPPDGRPQAARTSAPAIR